MLKKTKENSLSLIRLLTAFQVIYGHFIVHMGIKSHDWLSVTIGYFSGVPIFFAISGFLIWISINNSKCFGDYAKKRIFRIYPELWCGLAIEIVSIIVFYKKWELKSLALFTVTQGTVFQFWTPQSLRGYGCGTPNGTLWTICVTVQFYLVAWLLFKLLNKKNVYVWVAGFVVLVCTSIFGKMAVATSGNIIAVKLFEQTIFRHLWLFYIGCFISEFRNNILPVISRFWHVFVLAGLIPYFTKVDINASYCVFKTILLVTGLIGFAYRFPALSLKTDISYGLFIYHMIVANAFIAIGFTGNWICFFVALAISVMLAYASTVTVGKWSALKKRA